MRKRFYTGRIVLAVLLAVGFQRLAAEDWEGTPVIAIRHQPQTPGEIPMEPAVLGNTLAQKSGEPYSAQAIRESIERLFATGRFADVQVDARREAGGVVLTFLTKGRYFIGAVIVRGVAAPPSEGQLHAATRLQLGYPFSEEQIPVSVEGLRRTLEDEGYFQAEIVPSLHAHPETQQMDITVDVRAGERARLGKVMVTGSPAFSEARLIRQAKWKAGKSVTSQFIQNGMNRLRKLYREEDYLEASLRVTRKLFHPETNRADLELEAVAGSKIAISVTGASVSRSKLAQLIPVFEEGAVDEDLLQEGERNLRDYFEARGYFEVKVRYVRKPQASGGVSLEYPVELGPHQHLKEIRISGNHYFGAEVLRERMRIETSSLTALHGRFSSSLLEQDLASIRALYQANGFSQAQVTGKVVGPGTEQLAVAIAIEEGPQVLVGNFSILGDRSFPQEQLESYINAGSGQPYSESVVASDRDNLLTFYFNEGFLDTRFQWRATPSEDGKTVDLEYTIEEGDRQYVRHVFVNGLQFTRRGVVNRQLQFRDGEPLSQGEMLEAQRRLYDLGIFSQAKMAVQNPGGSERKKNILIYLEEARRYTLKIGLGADAGRFGGSPGDVTNVEGKNEVSPNVSLDLTRINVGGRPHTASFRSRFSFLQKRAGLTYTAPRFLNYPWLNASASALFDETRDVRTFSARRVEGSLQVESKPSRATTLLHRYTFRRVTVDTETLRISSEQVPFLSRPVLVGMLSQTVIRDTRDDPTDARQGMFSTVDFGVAAAPLRSEASFFRTLLQNSSYHRLGKRLVLARSFQVGLQSPFGKGRRVEVSGQQVLTREIPIAERYFAGGGNSHRGFAVNQTGPRDPETGFAVGGNALLLNGIELRFPVWKENISGVLFHDAGNVFARVRDISLRQHQSELADFSYISHAVGIGLRYRTPVGPVRFDLGYNPNPTRFLISTGGQQNLSRWQLLFSIGQSF